MNIKPLRIRIPPPRVPRYGKRGSDPVVMLAVVVLGLVMAVVIVLTVTLGRHWS